MKFAFDTDEVLRDTLSKMKATYEKFFIEDYVSEEGEEEFAPAQAPVAQVQEPVVQAQPTSDVAINEPVLRDNAQPQVPKAANVSDIINKWAKK